MFLERALIALILNLPEQQKKSHYEAWQVISLTKGHSGSGGLQALQDLAEDGISLAGVSVTTAYLSGIKLLGADLTNANFEYSELSESNLSGANLSSANLEGTNLKGAKLGLADLRGAKIDSQTKIDSKRNRRETEQLKFGVVDPNLLLTGCMHSNKLCTSL